MKFNNFFKIKFALNIFFFAALILTLSCSNKDDKFDNAKYTDYVQVDSPNSFKPLGIIAMLPENAKNGKYAIINKNVAEINFDYMNNNYYYRASKDLNSLLSFFGEYTNKRNDIIEYKEYKIDVKYNISSSNEKFTLWQIDDIYYSISTKIDNDESLTNLSIYYIKSYY